MTIEPKKILNMHLREMKSIMYLTKRCRKRGKSANAQGSRRTMMTRLYSEEPAIVVCWLVSFPFSAAQREHHSIP